MTVDVVSIIDWLARVSLFASAARLGMHWAKGGLQIWFKSESAFWAVYGKIEDTLAWLAIALQKYGKKEQVAAEAIKELVEHPRGTEVDVTVMPVEPKQ